MGRNSSLVLIALLAAATALPARAQPEPSHTRFGAEKAVYDFTKIQIRNFQDESLGRITDLRIALVNGRIVEVLVVSDNSLDVGNKIVAVPPLAVIPDQFHEIYRVNISAEAFKTAAAIDLSKWTDAGRSDRVAAAYRLFRQEPHFLEEGQPSARTRDRAAFTREESYKGPRTSDPLEQGTSYRDVDRTVAIHQQTRAAKVNGRHVEIGTNDGRAPLRGGVYTSEDKNRINEIAVAASRVELADNQIVVGKPVNGD